MSDGDTQIRLTPAARHALIKHLAIADTNPGLNADDREALASVLDKLNRPRKKKTLAFERFSKSGRTLATKDHRFVIEHRLGEWQVRERDILGDRLGEALNRLGVRRGYPSAEEARRQLQIALEVWDSELPHDLKPLTARDGVLGGETEDGLFRLSRRRDGSWDIWARSDSDATAFARMWGLTQSRYRSREQALTGIAQAYWRELQRPVERRCRFAAKIPAGLRSAYARGHS